MSGVSLSGVKEIIADTISLQEGSKIVNIKEKFYDKSTVNTMLSSVVGLPPNTLNSLEKVSTALNGDPNFFTTVNDKFKDKQNTLSNGTLITGSKKLLNTTTSTLKNIVGTNLTLTETENNLTIEATDAYDKPNIDNKFLNKQDKFIIAGTLPAGTSRLFDVSSNKFKAINVSSPMAISATSDDYLSITCDSYNKNKLMIKLVHSLIQRPNYLTHSEK